MYGGQIHGYNVTLTWLSLLELAPLAVASRDESECEDRECVCAKRNGKKALDRLRFGRSRTGVRYVPFYEHVMRYFLARRDDPDAVLPFPKELELACFN